MNKGLKLIVSDLEEMKDGFFELPDSVIPVRWCITKAIRDKLDKKRVKHPHILIIVTRDNREISRHLIPLDQKLEYIQFYKPGINVLFATIVWDSDGKIKNLKKAYLGEGSNRVIDEYNGCLYDSYTELAWGQLKVDVAEDLFASEPAEWEKWWVNLLFGTRVKDQCHFRKRRLFAYSIKPFLIFWFLLFKWVATPILAGIAALRGARDLKRYPEQVWGNIIHPFRYSIEDLYDIMRDDDTFFSKDKNRYWRHFLIRAMQPLYLITYLTIIAAISWLIGENFFKLLLLVISGFVVLLAIGFFLNTVFEGIFQKWLNWLEKKAAEREEASIEKERVKIEQLVCAGLSDPSMRANINALPEEDRTVHLRFQRLKSKVCKPFARR